jgi:hypothetical protein
MSSKSIHNQQSKVWFLCGPNHKKDDYHCEKDKADGLVGCCKIVWYLLHWPVF